MAEGILPPITSLFTKNWWILLLRGAIAMLFGFLAITRPVITVALLVLLFGTYALLDGIFTLFAAIAGWRHLEDRWLLVLEALIGIGAGFATLYAPALTTVAVIFFIAVWALAIGVLRVVEAIRLRKEIPGEFWLALSGIACVAFAFLVLLRPAAGALAMTWMIGWFALFWGAMLVMLSFRLLNLRRLDHEPGGTYRRAA